MVEAQIPETQWQPITLPNDASYTDLAKAHDEGVDSKGRTEDQLYPAQQAVADNAEHYKDEVDKTKYVFDVNRFKDGRLEEASDRLGKDPEELSKVKDQLERVFVKLQQQNTETFKRLITAKKYYHELAGALNDINQSVGIGRITGEQAIELRAALNVKGAELQQQNTENFKQAIKSSESQEGIDALLVDIDRSANIGRITEESREILRKEAFARRPNLPPKLEKVVGE